MKNNKNFNYLYDEIFIKNKYYINKYFKKPNL